MKYEIQREIKTWGRSLLEQSIFFTVFTINISRLKSPSQFKMLAIYKIYVLLPSNLSVILKLLSISWCVPLVVTAVFQAGIIEMGVKSQKVQVETFLHLLFNSDQVEISSQVCLQGPAVVRPRMEMGIQWTFLFMLPFALLIYPTILIYILLINHNNGRLTPQDNIAKAKVIS